MPEFMETPVLSQIRRQFLRTLSESELYVRIARRLAEQIWLHKSQPSDVVGDYAPFDIFAFFAKRCRNRNPEVCARIQATLARISQALECSACPVDPTELIPPDVFGHLLGFSIVRKSDAFSEFYYSDIDSEVLDSEEDVEFLKGSVWADAKEIEGDLGSSSIARTLRSKAICIPDTFADPSGSVACEDLIQGNYSFISYEVPALSAEPGEGAGASPAILVTMYWPLSGAFDFGKDADAGTHVDYDDLLASFPRPDPETPPAERRPVANEFDIFADVVDANAHAIRYWCRLQDGQMVQDRFRELLDESTGGSAGMDDETPGSRILKALVSDQTDGDPVGAAVGIYYEVTGRESGASCWKVKPTKFAACKELLEHRLCADTTGQMRGFARGQSSADAPARRPDCVIPRMDEVDAFARFHIFFPEPAQPQLECKQWCRAASDGLDHSCRLTTLMKKAWAYYVAFIPEIQAWRASVAGVRVPYGLIPAKIVAGAIQTLLQQMATALTLAPDPPDGERIREEIERRIDLAIGVVSLYVGFEEGAADDLKTLVAEWRALEGRPPLPLAVSGHLLPQEHSDPDDRWWSTERVALVMNGRGLEKFLAMKVASDATPTSVSIDGAGRYHADSGSLGSRASDLLKLHGVEVAERVCWPVWVRSREGGEDAREIAGFVSLWSAPDFEPRTDLLEIVILEAENTLATTQALRAEAGLKRSMLQKSMVHELKNRLLPIRGAIELFEAGQTDTLERAKKLLSHLSVSCNAIYDASRTEISDGIPLEQATMAVSAAVHGAIELANYAKDDYTLRRNYGEGALGEDLPHDEFVREAVAFLPAEWVDMKPTDPEELRLTTRLLYTMLLNLIRDAWRYHRAVWADTGYGLRATYDRRISAPIGLNLQQTPHGWHLAIENNAVLDERLMNRSFLWMFGYPSGIVTPVSPFACEQVNAAELNKHEMHWLKGSALAQSIAEHIKVELTLTARDDGSPGTVINCDYPRRSA